MEGLDEFIQQRIDVFESQHGPLADDARECLMALLSAAIRADPLDIGLLMESAEGSGESRGPCCFCQREE